MKISLLLMLLPLHLLAQSGPHNYIQQNQQSMQNFNRMTNQRTQNLMQRQLQSQNTWPVPASSPLSPEERQQAQAKQQQLEQAANESLARLAQEQQRRRQENPANTPQLAAAQQKADDQQLAQLAATNYREVFLGEQARILARAQELSANARLELQRLNGNLQDDTWWDKQRKQEDAQLMGTIKAYRDTLNQLATGLLGFELASPPANPAPFSVSSLNSMLANDMFDPNAATQLIRDAALSERLLAGDEFARAVLDFNTLTTTAAANPALLADRPKLSAAVQQSLQTVNKKLYRYHANIFSSGKVYDAEKAVRKSISAYLAKNRK